VGQRITHLIEWQFGFLAWATIRKDFWLLPCLIDLRQINLLGLLCNQDVRLFRKVSSFSSSKYISCVSWSTHRNWLTIKLVQSLLHRSIWCPYIPNCCLCWKLVNSYFGNLLLCFWVQKVIIFILSSWSWTDVIFWSQWHSNRDTIVKWLIVIWLIRRHHGGVFSFKPKSKGLGFPNTS
jgi:hypothetical protein